MYKHIKLYDGEVILENCSDNYIYKIDNNGKKVWEFRRDDYYRGFSNLYLEDERLFAIVWAGFKFELDPLTGKILQETYTK